MTTSIASFGLELTDHLSGPSKQASASIANLKTRLEDTREALKRYQLALLTANESGSIAGRQSALDGIKKSERGISDLTSKLGELTSASSKSASELASFSGSELAALGTTGPLGVAIAAVTATIALEVAAVVGLAEGLYQLTVFSLDTVNANDKLRSSFEALGGAGSGSKVLALVDELGEKLPQSRGELAKWAQSIQKMGVTDVSQIRNELLATASAQAILGEQGAGAYEKISRKVRDAIDAHHGLKITSKELTRTLGDNLAGVAAGKLGLTLGQLETKLKAGTVDAVAFGDALSTTLRERGKGPLDAMSNSLDSIGAKAKEALAHLFDGVDTAPITNALRDLVALGNQGAPSGQALKAGITPALNLLITLIGSAIHTAEILFLKLEIGSLKAYLAMRPLLSTLKAIGSPILSALGVDMSGPGAQKGIAAVAPQRTLIEQPGKPAKERVGVTTLDRHASIEVTRQIARVVAPQAIAPGAFGAKGAAPQVQHVDKSSHVGSIVVNITAPDGVTGAGELSSTGLAVGLERMQLASGR